jgi:hypothetical protein
MQTMDYATLTGSENYRNKLVGLRSHLLTYPTLLNVSPSGTGEGRPFRQPLFPI